MCRRGEWGGAQDVQDSETAQCDPVMEDTPYYIPVNTHIMCTPMRLSTPTERAPQCACQHPQNVHPNAPVSTQRMYTTTCLSTPTECTPQHACQPPQNVHHNAPVNTHRMCTPMRLSTPTECAPQRACQQANCGLVSNDGSVLVHRW